MHSRRLQARGTLMSLLRKLLAGIFLLPLAVLVLWSVALRWPWPSLLPAAYTDRWWLGVFSPSGAGHLVGESVLLGLLATFFALLLALPVSRQLTREAFPGKSIVEVLVLAPLAVPSLSAALGLQEVLLRLALPPSFLAVLAAHVIFILPYAVLILREGWRQVPPEMEHQARLLGASGRQAFIHVSLPLLTPALTLCAGFGFIVSLSQYLPTLLLGGGQVSTLSTLLLPVIRNGERGPASVLATVFVLTALGFCLFLSRLTHRFTRELNYE